MNQKENIAFGKLNIVFWMCLIIILLLVMFIIYNLASTIQKEAPFNVACILQTISYIIVFVTLAVVLWKMFKALLSQCERKNELNRKMIWEAFQNDLNKEERIERDKYNMIRDLVEKIDGEKLQAYALKKDLESLRAEMDAWKNEKEKQVFAELIINSKLTPKQ